MMMQTDLVDSRLKTHFPTLCAARETLPDSAFKLVTVPVNTTIFDIGGACEQYLLLTAGRVGVKMLSRNGKSILLYHVNPGESCIVTTSCLLGEVNYPTFGETETDIEALVVPRQAFKQALNQCQEFRRFVFDGMGQRLADVMQRLEFVNFTSIDGRLASALLYHRTEAGSIAITHEALAEEIGTAREVVSRHLKKMQNAGLLELGRGTVALHNITELETLRDSR